MENEFDNIIAGDNLIIEDLAQWVQISIEGKSVSSLIPEMGYKRISLYGYGHLGRLLEADFKKSGIQIDCVFDKKFKGTNDYFRSSEGELPDSDTIIVSVPLYYDSIRKTLKSRGFNGDIRLIDELLFQL